METFTITTNGTILHGSITGNYDANTIIVTLHGGPGGNKEDMQKHTVCQTLEQDYLLVYFDQRGCGESTYDLRQGLQLSILIEDVKVVIDYIKTLYPTAIISLLGFSYGGFLGFSFIEAYPTSVSHYIACNPAITFSSKEAKELKNRNQERYQNRFPALQISNSAEAMESKEFVDFVFSPQNKSHSLQYIYAIKEWFFTKHFTTILQDIKMPTLIQQGKLDAICNETALFLALNKIQNNVIQYDCLPFCHHDIDDINGIIITKNIIKFIKKNKKGEVQ